MRGPLLEGLQQRWLEPLRQQFALSRMTFLNHALTWCRQHHTYELERRLLSLATELSPTNIELLERLSLLTLRLSGLREVQQLCQRWRSRWQETVSRPFPAELEQRLQLLYSGEWLRIDDPPTAEPSTPQSPTNELPAQSPAHELPALSSTTELPAHSSTNELPAQSPLVSALAASNLRGVLERSAFSQECEEVLQLALVLGPQFEGRQLLACLPDSPALLSALETLLRVGLLQDAPEDRYAFVSEALQQRLYLLMSRARRQHLHARCARALLEQLAREPQPLEPTIAQLEAAGDKAEAGRLAVQALQLCHARNQHERVRALSTWALTLLPESAVETRWSALQARVEASIALRLADGLEDDVASLERLLPDMPESVQARLLLARLHVNIANMRGVPAEILAACRALVELVEAHGPPEDCCHANLQYVTTLLGLGYFKQADQALERARGHARQLQNPEPLTHVEVSRALQLSRHLRLREGRECLQALRKELPRLRDEGLRVRLMMTYVSLLVALGETHAAILEARTLQERLLRRENLYYSDILSYFLTRALTEHGHYGEALQELERIQQERPLTGDLLHRLRVNQLDLALRLEQPDRAQAVLDSGQLPPPNTLLTLSVRPLSAQHALQQGRLAEVEHVLNLGAQEAQQLDSLQGEVELRRIRLRLLLVQRRYGEAEQLALDTLTLGEPIYPGGRWPTWRLRILRELLNLSLVQGAYIQGWAALTPLLPCLEQLGEGYDGAHILLFQGWLLATALQYPREAQLTLTLARRQVTRLASQLGSDALRAHWLDLPTQRCILQAQPTALAELLAQAPF